MPELSFTPQEILELSKYYTVEAGIGYRREERLREMLPEKRCYLKLIFNKRIPNTDRKWIYERRLAGAG